MDDATADLILSLQFEDLMSLNDDIHTNTDTATGGTTDAEVALRIYREELRNNALALSDHRFGTKLGEAGDINDQPPSPVESPTPAFDNLLTKDKNDSSQYCTACGEHQARCDLITAPCGHFYCRPCIGSTNSVDDTEGLFVLAMKDESLFPPRCCNVPIPLAVARPFLDQAQARQFEEKTVEYGTTDKTYCHNTECGKFILPTAIEGETARCRHCDLTTCSVCKSATHDDDCPRDPAYIALMELAEAEGWRRCEKCKRLVELNFGCNHMTCLCGAQFCYLCGVEWKNCPCGQWDEDRLIARREQVVARADRPLENARVQQIDEDLRIRHECEHRLWRRLRICNVQCEECRQHQPWFILECPLCHLRACTRCTQNRL